MASSRDGHTDATASSRNYMPPSEQNDVTFNDDDDDSSIHFVAYLFTAIILILATYILYHGKRKRQEVSYDIKSRVGYAHKRFKVQRKFGGRVIKINASSFHEFQRKCADRFSFKNVIITRDGRDFLPEDFASASNDTLLRVSCKPDLQQAPERQHKQRVPAHPPETTEISSTDINELANEVSHHLLRPIGDKLGFNSAQVDKYELDMRLYSVPEGYIKMFNAWARKDIRTRKELEDIIKSVRPRQSSITDQTVVQPDHLDVDQFRRELKQYYLGKYCRIKRDSWESKDFELKTYFTTLSLLEIEEEKDSVRKVPLENSHHDIFSLEVNGNKPSRLLVRGEGGTGKTTLCKKLAFDWAQEEPNSPLKNVRLVCVIEFRRLKETENIENAICSQLLSRSSKIRPEQIKAYMEQHPSDMILIFDGLDEFKSKEYTGDIKDIVQWESLRDVRVLVTTRPWHSLSLQNHATYTQLDLEGFDEQGVKSYVKMYFADEATQYMNQIEANKAIHLLASTPILLAMICYVLKRFGSISEIKTLGQLFDYFLRALFFNKVWGTSISDARNYTDQTPAKSTEMQKLKQFWNDLGKIALPALLKPGKKLLFSNADFAYRTGILYEGLTTGLLVRHETELSGDALDEQEVYYSFPHLLFQEKCAGDYLKKCDQDTLHAYLKNIKTKRAALNLQYMLLFTCGKECNRKTTKSIINHLVTLHDQTGDTHNHPSNGWKAKGNIINLILGLEMTFDDSYIDEPNLDEEIKDDDLRGISTKLSQGMSFMADSLLELGLFINYESQMEGQMSQSLTKLLPRGINSEMKLRKGDLIYPAQLYFLKFTNSSITTLSKIQFCSCDVSFEEVMGLSRNCSCTNLELFRSSIRVINPEQFAAKNNSMSNLTGIKLCEISTTIPLHDVILLMTILCPKWEDLNIEACEVDIKPYTELETTSNTYRVISPEDTTYTYKDNSKSNLKSITLKRISTTISLYDLLALVTTLCPVLTDLVVRECSVDIKPYKELETTSEAYPAINTVTASPISNITTIQMYDILNPIKLYDMLGMTTICPLFKSLLVAHCTVDLKHYTTLPIKLNKYNSCLEGITMSKCKNAVSMIDLLGITSMTCPNLSKLYLTVCTVEVLDHTRLHKTDHRKKTSQLTIQFFGCSPRIPIVGLIAAASVFYESLKAIEINPFLEKGKVKIPLPSDSIPSDRSIELKYMDINCDEGISLSSVLAVTSVMCPHLRNLRIYYSGGGQMLSHKTIVKPHQPDDLPTAASSLEEMRVETQHYPTDLHTQLPGKMESLDILHLIVHGCNISVIDIFRRISEICPQLKDLKLSVTGETTTQEWKTSEISCNRMLSLEDLAFSALSVPLLAFLEFVATVCPQLNELTLTCDANLPDLQSHFPNLREDRISGFDVINESCGRVSCKKLISLHTISFKFVKPVNLFVLLVRVAHICPNVKKLDMNAKCITCPADITCGQIKLLETIHLESQKGFPSLCPVLTATANLCPNLKQMCISGYKVVLGNIPSCQLLSLEWFELSCCEIASLVHLFDVTNNVYPNLRKLRVVYCKFLASEQSPLITCDHSSSIEELELDYYDEINPKGECESFESIEQIISIWCPNAKDLMLVYHEELLDDGDSESDNDG